MRWILLFFLCGSGGSLFAQQHQFGIQLHFQQRILATRLKAEAADPTLVEQGKIGFGLGSNYLGRLSRRFAISAEANLLFDEEEFRSRRFAAVQPDITIVELNLPVDLYYHFTLAKDWRPFLGLGLSYGHQLTTGSDYEVFYPRHQFGGRVSLGIEKVFRQFTCAPRVVYQQMLNEQLRNDNWLTVNNYEYLHVQRLQFTLAFYGPQRRKREITIY